MSARRKLTAAAVCTMVGLVLGVGPAEADRGTGNVSTPTESQPDEIGSMVQYKESASASERAPMVPAVGHWEPPACWYEPKYSPAELESHLAKDDYGTGSAGHEEGRKYNKVHFHEGDKGVWYELMGDSSSDPVGYGKCALHKDTYLWIGPADPAPPNAPVIDPQILAGLAYNRTTLPAPPVMLSPEADHQVVNLATYATFARRLDRVWVTAGLHYLGVDVAATTVATPEKLRLDAGTEYADPQSCTYDLSKKGNGYAVDTKNAGCNITYRKSSGDGHYTLRASITWKVTWTASADPDGPVQQPALPDGLSTVEQAVTVKEIQTVNR
jgi:hypothetical protein